MVGRCHNGVFPVGRGRIRLSCHQICGLRPSLRATGCVEQRWCVAAVLSGSERGGGPAAMLHVVDATSRRQEEVVELTEPTSQQRASCGCIPADLGLAVRPSSVVHEEGEENGSGGVGCSMVPPLRLASRARFALAAATAGRGQQPMRSDEAW